MATSKFIRNFKSLSNNSYLTSGTLELLPYGNTYPTGALALTHEGSGDWKRDACPDGEYSLYYNGTIHPRYQRFWIGENRQSAVANRFDANDKFLQPLVQGLKATIDKLRTFNNLSNETELVNESVPLSTYAYGKYSSSGNWYAPAWITQIKAVERRLIDKIGIFIVGDFESNPNTEFQGDLYCKVWVNDIIVHTETILNSVLLTKVPFTTFQNAETFITPANPIALNVNDTLTIGFQHTGALKISFVFKTAAVDSTKDWGINKYTRSFTAGYIASLTTPPALSAQSQYVPIHCYSYQSKFVNKLETDGRLKQSAMVDRLLRFNLASEKTITAVGANGGTASGAKVTVPIGETGLYSWVYCNYDTTLYSRAANLYGKTLVFEFISKIKNITSFQMRCTLLSAGSGQINNQGSSQVYEYLETYVAGNEIYYKSRMELVVNYNDLTNIQTYFQTTNNSALASEGTFEVLEATMYIKGEEATTVLSSSNKTFQQIIYENERKAAIIVAASTNADFLNPQKRDYTTLTVKQDGTGDYTDIQSAIDAAALLATVDNQYEIEIHPGTYEATQLSDYHANPWYGFYDFITIYPYVHLRGVDKERCIIYSELSGAEATLAYTTNHQTIGFYQPAKIENLTVKCFNNRYPVHQDAGQTGMQNKSLGVINCDIIHLGCDAGLWASPVAWGCGLSDGQYSYFENVLFESLSNAFYFHTNKEFNRGTVTELKNCKTRTPLTGIAVQAMGSLQNDRLIINNCSINGGISYSNGVSWLPTTLANSSPFRSEVKISGGGNSPAPYKNTTLGAALRIVSNTTGASSSVRVSGTGADAIMDADNYLYKDGVDVLAGYACGVLDIGEDGTGPSANVYVKSLGKRLGDCSSVNKTLTITIDGGTPVDVVFSTNLTNETNANIIGTINTAISGQGVAAEYYLGREYYPEFEEVANIQNSSATVVIQKGMAVKLASLYQVSKMASSDEADDFYGIALEDIRPSEYGKILTKGMMYVPATYSHYPLQTSYEACALGSKYGIDPDNAGKFKKNATPTLLKGIANDIIKFNM